MMCLGVLAMILLGFSQSSAMAQSAAPTWRAASEEELRSFLPARAVVEKEHIETEMRTASGITDGHGKFVAGIVLITAGYSADGKYSHYFVAQTPIQIGDLALSAGEYVFGWQRDEDSLNVHFYDALTGALRGDVKARRLLGDTRVEAFKVWPAQIKPIIQIGRFGMQYRIPPSRPTAR